MLLGFASESEWFPGLVPVGNQATTTPSAHPYLAVFKCALKGISNSGPTFRTFLVSHPSQQALLTPSLPNPKAGNST